MIKNTFTTPFSTNHGFIASFSRLIHDNVNKTLRINALVSLVNGFQANNIFYNDLNSEHDNLFNRMNFFGEKEIHVINVRKHNSLNEPRVLKIDVRKRNEKAYNMYEVDLIYIVRVYNLTLDEFLNLETIYYITNENSPKYLLFFEDMTWGEIVNHLYMLGITVTGGSTNQRHIYNKLSFNMTTLLITLFGTYFAQGCTDFMRVKSTNKSLFNSDFFFHSKENEIFRNFNKVIYDNEKTDKFVKISSIILSNSVDLGQKILHWDILRVWMKLAENQENEREIILELLELLLNQVIKGESEDSILNLLKEKFKLLNDELVAPEVLPKFTTIFNYGNNIGRHEFIVKRFTEKSSEKYSFTKDIKFKNPFSIHKRGIHTSSRRFDNKIKESNLTLKKEFKISKFLGLVQDIKKKEVSTREKQLLLENSWETFYTEAAKDAYKNKSSTVFFDVLEQFAERLNILYDAKVLNRKFGSFALLINDPKWFYLTLTLLFSSINKGYNSVCINVGENILSNIFYNLKKIETSDSHKNKIFLDQFKPKIINQKVLRNKTIYELFTVENLDRWKTINYEDWQKELGLDVKLVLSLGDFFISFFTDEISNNKTYFLRVPSKINFKDPYIIILNKSLIEESIEGLSLHPNSLPLLHQPDLWGENKIGGFLIKNDINSELVSNPKKEMNKHKVTNLEKGYDVINKLNSIKFQINEELLDYLNGDGYYLLEDLKRNNEDWVFNELSLQIAETFKGVTIYFSHFLDWRSRIYNSSFSINYQGSDLGSALILYEEGKPLDETGVYFLYIALANSHNLNKISKNSFQARYNWVVENYNKIINLDKEFILKAEKKMNFVSLALTLREFDKNKDYKVKNPIFLDATCSGIQHVAALIRDFDLATLTNLNESDKDSQPEDFYTDVINKVNKEINEFGRKNLEYSNLEFVKLTRDIAKQSIMTVVYNVSKYGMKEQLAKKTKILIENNSQIDDVLQQRNMEMSLSFAKSFKKGKNKQILIYKFPSIIENEEVILNVKDVFMISKLLNEFLFYEYKGLGRVYIYLTELAKITNILNLPIVWKAPNGLEFEQYYKIREKNTLKVKLFGISKELSYLKYVDKVNKEKQKNSIIPNVIHTLDASHLFGVIQESRENNINNIIGVHDCFGTHPNDMGQLHHIVRRTFILQYTQSNFLKGFRDKIISFIKLNDYEIIEDNGITQVKYENELYPIPNVPEMGEYDINLIKGSNYIIC